MSKPSEEEIRDVISRVVDPEVGIGIVDLGLIYKIDLLNWPKIYIQMTMTTPACPLTSVIKENIHEELHANFSEVKSIEIDVTYDPPWNPENMSEGAKKRLGWK